MAIPLIVFEEELDISDLKLNTFAKLQQNLSKYNFIWFR